MYQIGPAVPDQICTANPVPSSLALLAGVMGLVFELCALGHVRPPVQFPATSSVWELREDQSPSGAAFHDEAFAPADQADVRAASCVSWTS